MSKTDKKSLPEKLQELIEETKGMIDLCKTLPGGNLCIIENDYRKAKEALVSNDAVLMIRAVENLKQWMK